MGSKNMATHDFDNSKDILAVQHLASLISSLQCSACHHKVFEEEGDIVAFCTNNTNEFDSTCVTCKATTCLGCGQVLTATTKKLETTTSDGQEFTWHCDSARLGLIWSVLCSYDDLMQHNSQTKQATVTNTKKKTSKVSGYERVVDPDDLPASMSLAAITALLPSSANTQILTDFDLDPPATLISIIKCSSILDKTAELLRNTSLEDATKR